MTTISDDPPGGGEGSGPEALEAETVAEWLEANGWADDWLARKYAPDPCTADGCDRLPPRSEDPLLERRARCDEHHEPYQRPVVHHRQADDWGDGARDVYIGRHTVQGRRVSILTFAAGELEAGQSGYLGNPYKVGDPTTPGEFPRGESVARFAATLEYLMAHYSHVRLAVRGLSGARLGCWCRHADETAPCCHGDVLATWCEQLNGPACEAGEHKVHPYLRPPERGYPEEFPWRLFCRRCGRGQEALPAAALHDVAGEKYPDFRGGIGL